MVSGTADLVPSMFFSHGKKYIPEKCCYMYVCDLIIQLTIHACWTIEYDIRFPVTLTSRNRRCVFKHLAHDLGQLGLQCQVKGHSQGQGYIVNAAILYHQFADWNMWKYENCTQYIYA